MKKLILIAGIILMSWVSRAQYFDMNSHWTEVTYDKYNFHCMINHYEVGDTFYVNGHIYNKLFLNNELLAGLRETEDGKLLGYFIGDNIEQQIYDFDWHIGDTIGFYIFLEEFEMEYKITSIDSLVLEDGNYHKYINRYKKLIQGIGYTDGFLTHFFPVSPSLSYDMLCFYRGDQLVYSNPKYNTCENCDSLNLGLDKKQISGIKQYVVGDNIFLEVDGFVESIESIIIYTSSGKICRYYEKIETNSICISGLERGIYFYKIKCNNLQINIGKIYKP